MRRSTKQEPTREGFGGKNRKSFQNGSRGLSAAEKHMKKQIGCKTSSAYGAPYVGTEAIFLLHL